MGLVLSFLGVAVSALAFGAATREDRERERVQAQPRPHLAMPAPQFFVEALGNGTAASQPRVPIEVILLQLERHVRLEQAAAESFLLSPTVKSLHTRTSSPLVH